MFNSQSLPAMRSTFSLSPSCLLASLLALAGMAQAAPLDPETLLQLQRLQQLELAAGQPLALETALCMDQQLGPAWKLPGAGALPPSRWQAVAERIRLSAEQCTLPDDGRQYRDTASWRAALRGKLAQREQMEAERRRLRACVAQAADADQLKQCIAAPGQPPLTPETWQRWLTLYANRSVQ